MPRNRVRPEAEKALSRYLAGRGQRLTRERRLVLQAALEIEGHFDIDQLQEHLRRQRTPVHRSTTYRILPALVESGLLRKLLHGERGAIRYEHVIGHARHYHLACVACGRIIEFRQPVIARALDEICRKHRFTAVERRLCIRGTCRQCGSPARSRERKGKS